MLIRTWKCKLSTIAFLEKISNSLNFSTKISSVERDHCIAKLLGLKDISSLHTQWNKMVFPIFHVFQLNLHMIFESNVSFQNHIQIGKFMKWNYMTSSWNYKVHVDRSTHESLQYHQTSMTRLLEFKNTFYNPSTRLTRKSREESLNFNSYYKINYIFC